MNEIKSVSKWIYDNVFWLVSIFFFVMYCINLVNENGVMAIVDFIGVYANLILHMLMCMRRDINEAN